MNVQSRNRIFVALFVAIVASSLLIAASVGASPNTRSMEVCALHGLGPNFRDAEGPDSALLRCLDTATADTGTVTTSHTNTMEACALHGLGPNFAAAEGSDSALARCLDTATATVDGSQAIGYREGMAIVGALDPSQVAHAPISFREALRVMGD